MRRSSVASDTLQWIAQAADPERTVEVLRVVPEAKTNGAAVPVLREIAKRARKEHSLDFQAACALCSELIAAGGREAILVGVFLVALYPKHCAAVNSKLLDKWLNAVDNWETCDQLAANIAAYYIAAHPAEGRRHLIEHAKSKNKWRRRYALSASAALNQRGRFVPEVTLAMCQFLLEDPEPMLQTALGWAIRELSKKDAEQAFGFLVDNKARMKRSTLREASLKLPGDLRSRLV